MIKIFDLPQHVVIVKDPVEAGLRLNTRLANAVLFPSVVPADADLPPEVLQYLYRDPIQVQIDDCPVVSVAGRIEQALLSYKFPSEGGVLWKLIEDVERMAVSVSSATGQKAVHIRISSDWYRGATWHVDPNRVVATIVYCGPSTQFVHEDDVLDCQKITEIPVRGDAKHYCVPERWMLVARGDKRVMTSEGESVYSRGLVHRKPPEPWGQPPTRRVLALVFRDYAIIERESRRQDGSTNRGCKSR
ncbi:DUF1826 domain-containing protein [Rhizobium mongolense]|uniref:DUF1826 domain-containing protein n=1 Tax=Rhizobium mongolense TaxID=57676 RepID=UPI0034A47A83